VSPRSRTSSLASQEGASSKILGRLAFLHPSQHQDPYPQDYELPLDESRSLLFCTFNGTPIVMVVRRQPQAKNPRTHQPSVVSPFPWLGLIARAKRAGYCVVKGCLLCCGGRCLYPARRLLLSYHRLNSSLRSLAAHSLPGRTSGVVKRPFHILTSLLVAAREAMSLGKRKG